MSTVRARALKIIIDHLGVEPEQVIDSASFYGHLNADSLDTIELVMALEVEFGIEIPDDEAEQVTTVGECIAAPRAGAGGGDIQSRSGRARSVCAHCTCD